MDYTKVLLSLDGYFQNDKDADKYTAISCCSQLVKQFPYTKFVNAVFSKLIDLYTEGDNLKQVSILLIFQEHRQHLPKLWSIDHFKRRMISVLHSNDYIARSLTLRLIATFSHVLDDCREVSQFVIASLESPNPEEVISAACAASSFAARSRVFSDIYHLRIARVLTKPSTTPASATHLLHVLTTMNGSDLTLQRVWVICRDTFPSVDSSLVPQFLSTMTDLALKCPSLPHLDFLLDLIRQQRTPSLLPALRDLSRLTPILDPEPVLSTLSSLCLTCDDVTPLVARAVLPHVPPFVLSSLESPGLSPLSFAAFLSCVFSGEGVPRLGRVYLMSRVADLVSLLLHSHVPLSYGDSPIHEHLDNISSHFGGLSNLQIIVSRLLVEIPSIDSEDKLCRLYSLLCYFPTSVVSQVLPHLTTRPDASPSFVFTESIKDLSRLYSIGRSLATSGGRLSCAAGIFENIESKMDGGDWRNWMHCCGEMCRCVEAGGAPLPPSGRDCSLRFDFLMVLRDFVHFVRTLLERSAEILRLFESNRGLFASKPIEGRVVAWNDYFESQLEFALLLLEEICAFHARMFDCDDQSVRHVEFLESTTEDLIRFLSQKQFPLPYSHSPVDPLLSKTRDYIRLSSSVESLLGELRSFVEFCVEKACCKIPSFLVYDFQKTAVSLQLTMGLGSESKFPANSLVPLSVEGIVEQRLVEGAELVRRVSTVRLLVRQGVEVLCDDVLPVEGGYFTCSVLMRAGEREGVVEVFLVDGSGVEFDRITTRKFLL